jgi:hypothetical protein
VLALARRERRALWWSPLWFAALYFYVLETHTPVFARYALPLVPVICLLAAVPIVELAAVAGRFSRSPRALPLVVTLASLAIVSRPAIQTVSWIEGLKSRDTRVVAADWMRARLPQKARLVVEISGPTYMSAAGFSVTRVENIRDRTPSQYVRSDAGYLVISSGDLDRYRDYAQLGKLVFEIAPLNQRPGPPVRIIQIDRAEAAR